MTPSTDGDGGSEGDQAETDEACGRRRRSSFAAGGGFAAGVRDGSRGPTAVGVAVDRLLTALRRPPADAGVLETTAARATASAGAAASAVVAMRPLPGGNVRFAWAGVGWRGWHGPSGRA